MKRRSLFAMVPATSALLALRSQGKPIEASALTSAGFAISVQCWSFKEFTLFEAIEKAAQAGASAVEMFPGQKIGGTVGETKLDQNISDDDIAKILAHAKEQGITPVNFGVTGISKNEAEARKMFEFAKKMGLYGLTTESLDALDTMEKLAQEFDIKVCFHNHPKPNAMANPDKTWEAVKDRHANIGFCADIGHWATDGLNPVEVLKKIGPRVRSMHFKDREKIGAPTHDRPFGTGVVDLAGVLDEARKHGFAGNVSIEYEYNWKTNVPEIAQCVGYLRAYSKMAKA